MRDELYLDTGWSLTEAAFAAIVDALAPRDPRRILEFGSGPSTVRLAQAFPKARIVSLEHKPLDFARTMILLHRHNVKDRVDLRLAPLSGNLYGYDLSKAEPFDAVVVDGPPRDVEGGRREAGRLGLDKLAKGGILILDDYNELGEQLATAAWIHGPVEEMQQRVVNAGEKSLLMVEKPEEWTTVRTIADALVSIVRGDDCPSRLPFPQNWAEVLTAIDRHRLAGFCANHWLSAGSTKKLPRGVEEALCRQKLIAHARHRYAVNTTNETIAWFAASGVPVRPIKGAYLCSAVYDELPFRAVSDVDLVVAQSSFEPVRAMLEEHGYRFSSACRNRWQTPNESARDRPSERGEGREAYLPKKGAPIDLHWQIDYTIDGTRWELTAELDHGLSEPERQFLIVLTHACQDPIPQTHQILDLLMLCQKNGLEATGLVQKHLPQFYREGTVATVLKLLESFASAPYREAVSDAEAFVARSFAYWEGARTTGLRTIRRLPSLKQQLMFVVGYLVPNLAFYRESSTLKAWKKHWAHLTKRLFVAERRRPGGRAL